MANFNLTITNEGAAFLADVIVNHGTINFSEVRFSSTNYVGSEVGLTAGTFAGTFITAVPSASIVDGTTINVASSFTNATFTTDKSLYSIGVIADDGNGTDYLVAVATTSNPDILSKFVLSPSTYAYNVNLGVSSTEDITVTASTAGAVYIGDIVDNLTSHATNKPLSANQGRVLNDLIGQGVGTLAGLSDVDITSLQDGDLLTYDSVNQKWINTSRYKTFAAASDAEIAEMVRLADAGEIDLYDDCGWRVGQEHQIVLSGIAATGSFDGVSWSVGEVQGAQTITLVLMHRGLYELVNPVLDKSGQTRTTCSFVVGIKECLNTQGYIYPSFPASVTGSWKDSNRRAWCNGGFRSALPADLLLAFKQFKTITAESYNSAGNLITNDYFALPAGKEVSGADAVGGQYSNSVEGNALTQFTYYETLANRQKTANSAGVLWFTRSPSYPSGYDSQQITPYSYNCIVRIDGTMAFMGEIDLANGLSPFGCL